MVIDADLYYSPECPHCEKVIAFMQESGIEVARMHNVDEPGVAEEMVERTGAKGWPTLLLPDGESMSGDSTIIRYLESQA